MRTGLLLVRQSWAFRLRVAAQQRIAADELHRGEFECSCLSAHGRALGRWATLITINNDTHDAPFDFVFVPSE